MFFPFQDRRCTTICSQVTWRRSLICHQPKSHFPWIKCFLIGFYWHIPGWHPTFVQRGKAFDSLELSGAPRLRCLRLSGCKGLQTRQLHHGGKLGGFGAWWWMGLKNRTLKVWWFLLCFLKKVVEGWWKVNEGILFCLRLRWRWSAVNEFLCYYTWNTFLGGGTFVQCKWQIWMVPTGHLPNHHSRTNKKQQYLSKTTGIHGEMNRQPTDPKKSTVIYVDSSRESSTKRE